jgi:hypothetical protein
VVDPRTEAVIAGCLRYLASKQTASGAIPGSGVNHSAAFTAFAVHAFLAAGNLPNEGPHGKTVARAVDYLIDCARPDGYIAAATGESNMYGHGIATLVLGEVYGQSHDARLRPALERATRLIIQTQNAEGGWRYQPRIGDADVSVTLLQASALRVAKNAGLDVPQRTLDGATTYIRACFDPRSGGFAYQARGGAPGFGRTCGAIYALQLLGHYNDPMVLRGSEYTMAAFGKDMDWFTYGSFYGAPAHYMIGGAAWARWYAAAHDKLLPTAVVEGNNIHFRPLEGGNGQNDVFATSVYTTVLAMPYQFLPIYQR